MQFAVGIVREPLLDEIAVRLLGVVKESTVLTIHNQAYGTVVEKGNAELSAEPVGVNFRLHRSITTTVAGAKQIDVGFTEEPIVSREIHVIITTVSDRRIVRGRMIRAAVKPGASIINHTIGAVNERRILRIVAHQLFGGPLIDRALCDPEAICPEGADNRVVAPAHHAFAQRSVVGKSRANSWSKLSRSL